ncbi:YciI family protein [Nocardiopsis sp. FR26]|uniref:YciI family protein n=1 Tax=Nocardiopsis sp. FR26 TaxID=2605987 RepID=UPI001357360C|nr:YciI family protein [Nocardiopsis sp. FR26]
MRYLMMIMSDEQTEAGQLPGPEVFEAMNRYNEAMVKAGVLLAGEGLAPGSEGARVTFSDGRVTVTDGPFTEAKEVIAGYWVIQVSSREEALEWARRCPHPPEGSGAVLNLQLRRIAETEEFGDAVPEHVREQEARWRAEGIGNG